ncbi:hypothetical protein PIB30_080907 [Stylosanthes scabra]|uniref:Uncharacterized protein n=1 Tax=Stylosanthes scabra TaxID=79078 RepID=A0ABU6XTC0_9FABA|nr:hypothetical protein [Stylosanthes scabra]
MVPLSRGWKVDQVLGRKVVGDRKLGERFPKLFRNSLQKNCVIDECEYKLGHNKLGFKDSMVWSSNPDGRYSAKSFVDEVTSRKLGLPQEKHIYDKLWDDNIPPRYGLHT